MRSRRYQDGKEQWVQMQLPSFILDGENLTGSGSDRVGPFNIRGTLKNENVSFAKQYVGKHTVKYEGTLKKEKIEGTYKLPAKSGGGQGLFELKVGRSLLEQSSASSSAACSAASSPSKAPAPRSPQATAAAAAAAEQDHHLAIGAPEHTPFILQKRFWEDEGGGDIPAKCVPLVDMCMEYGIRIRHEMRNSQRSVLSPICMASSTGC